MNPFSYNLPQQVKNYRERVNAIPTSPKHLGGWCEGCQQVKPAPRGRKKGWKCQSCRRAKP